MEILAICRICLNDNVRHVVKTPQLQETYERLTTIPFQSDMRPLGLCYICYGQLRASHRFKLKCLQAEQLLAQMLDRLLGGDDAQDQNRIDRSALQQFTTSLIEQTNVNSAAKDANTNDTATHISYECSLQLEEDTTTDVPETSKSADSKPDNKQSQLDREDEKPLNNVEQIRVKKEVEDEDEPKYILIEVPMAEEHKLNPVANTVQGIQNVTKTDDDELEASQRNAMISEQDLNKLHNLTYQQNIHEHYCNDIMFKNDNANRDSSDGDKIFICDKCKNSFNKKSELIKHTLMRACDKPYICIVCDKDFTNITDLRDHALTHSSEKPFICIVCDKGFSKRSGLIAHVRTHTGEKPFVCSVCQKGFTHRSDLNKHSLTHSGQKPHVCHVCNKGFTQTSGLKSHLLTHTGEKPFVCNVCKKGFSRRSRLKAHVLTHTIGKPYVCNVCKKAFTHRSCLKRHSLIHTDVKPHVCNVCEKGFTQKANLKAHLRIHSANTE